ncbi:uncharacterized protein N7482_006288 [Penicillium canariense]|uniref:Mid2 domain-containing protein n=1 Tax=Penicillium canariense TaxID=189055 RepID=A0A9W9I9P4_9EURO|nr:uncharacterized protein N7482_006288 [Penicillium canariense]KAJ5167507.1 hypothetical protein N7482_006288 [Penicillium canariense]
MTLAGDTMDDSLDPLKRDKKEYRWENPLAFNSDPPETSGTDGLAMVVTSDFSQIDAALSSDSLLASRSASASVTPGSSTASWTYSSSDIASTTVLSTSSSLSVSESSTPSTTTLAISTTAAAMTLSGTSASTTSAPETAAPGAYSGGGESVKNKLAIALPIAIVGLLIILALVFFFLRRRRRRHGRPPYEMTANETPGVSTAALMAVPKIVTPDPAAASLPRSPVRDVSSQDHATAPVSASARSDNDSHTELGLAVAVPMDQRFSATEHTLRGFSRPPSTVVNRASAGPSRAGLASVCMPFQNQSSDDNDSVSIISGEYTRRDHAHDFDDMSSVSSLNDDHLESHNHGQSFR